MQLDPAIGHGAGVAGAGLALTQPWIHNLLISAPLQDKSNRTNVSAKQGGLFPKLTGNYGQIAE